MTTNDLSRAIQSLLASDLSVAENRLILADAYEESGSDDQAEWHRRLAQISGTAEERYMAVVSISRDFEIATPAEFDDAIVASGLPEELIELAARGRRPEVLAGSLFVVSPQDDEAMIASEAVEDDDGFAAEPAVNYGWHGGDVLPCSNGEWIGDAGIGNYVLDASGLVPGWIAVRADLDSLQVGARIAADGSGYTILAEKCGGGECVLFLFY